MSLRKLPDHGPSILTSSNANDWITRTLECTFQRSLSNNLFTPYDHCSRGRLHQEPHVSKACTVRACPRFVGRLSQRLFLPDCRGRQLTRRHKNPQVLTSANWHKCSRIGAVRAAIKELTPTEYQLKLRGYTRGVLFPEELAKPKTEAAGPESRKFSEGGFRA